MTFGESVFITKAVSSNDNGIIALAPSTPGQVMPLDLGAKQYRLNDGAFLALDGSAQYTMERQSVGKAFFGGQGGLFVMTTNGIGTLLVNAFGSIKKIELQSQENHNRQCPCCRLVQIPWITIFTWKMVSSSPSEQAKVSSIPSKAPAKSTCKVLTLETFANIMKNYIVTDGRSSSSGNPLGGLFDALT